jgi:hypothetical protein
VSLYRIYIDETGNHDLAHADDPNERFLALTGVIIESSYNTTEFQPELEKIKSNFFGQDPDSPVILHRKEIINRRPPFISLRDSEVQSQFNSVLLYHLAHW